MNAKTPGRPTISILAAVLAAVFVVLSTLPLFRGASASRDARRARSSATSAAIALLSPPPR